MYIIYIAYSYAYAYAFAYAHLLLPLSLQCVKEYQILYIKYVLKQYMNIIY